MTKKETQKGLSILIVSDAWNEVDGIVTTITNLTKELKNRGHKVRMLSHNDCAKSLSVPFYPDVKLGWVSKKCVQKHVQEADAVHIATPEGPIGFKVMRHCVRKKIKFTTGYHTKWPEIIKDHFTFPKRLTYKYVQWVHKHSSTVLVPIETTKYMLEDNGFENVKVWAHGVDRDVFKPLSKLKSDIREPLLLCVSHISNEKNVEEFCKMNVPGFNRKIIVGDGPDLERLEKKYYNIIFVGEKEGTELAHFYQIADICVFPSKTTVFSMAMLESIACGTPIAAYDVEGLDDIVEPGVNGTVSSDLEIAMLESMKLNRKDVYKSSLKYSWEKCADQFLDAIEYKDNGSKA